VLESTFQLDGAVGPAREKKLWQAGVASWDELAPSLLPASLPASVEKKLRAALEVAARARDAGDADRLASLIPSREHWRLFQAFADDAVYLDIETSDDVVGFAGISAIGICDRQGPRLFLPFADSSSRVQPLQAFPEAVDGKLLVTFNGLSFDLPILRRAFPEWTPPVCHIDLRHLFPRLGLEGGLKTLERRLVMLGLRRPPHLDGMGGWDAGSLYRRGRDGDRQALGRFAEYNLYDAINLRTLMAYAFNQLVEAEMPPAVRERVPTLPIPSRGDVLYDVSKILVELTS
jgi:uncharacterized protein YprB with RNaseH-like and TPR domain